MKLWHEFHENREKDNYRPKLLISRIFKSYMFYKADAIASQYCNIVMQSDSTLLFLFR